MRFRQKCSARNAWGFTLIEIMVVVAIFGMVLAIGIPPMAKVLRREGMGQAIHDIYEACNEARAQAVLGQTKAEIVIHPQDGTIAAGKFSGQIPSDVNIISVGVNFIQFIDSDEARVGFYPNGTSDEFSIVIQGKDGGMREIYLDIVAGRPEIKDR